MGGRHERRTVTAALIIIGNEILSGRTQDAKLAFLAQELNEIGIQMREVRDRARRRGRHRRTHTHTHTHTN